MTMQKLGHTRSTHQRDHLFQTPDTFVRASLTGMTAGTAIVHIAPAAGARFTQYTAELDSGGILGATTAQRFFYIISGTAELTVEGATHSLSANSYAYLPIGMVHRLHAPQAARVAVIEKNYIPLSRSAAPALLIGHESTITPTALGGDEDLRVCSLLPDDPRFDFAVNTMTYQPGAALSMVEVHVMEHGLLMLEGGGIYRLGDSWYPVTAGDFIWMAPYCPQWFGALGKQPAKYLIYKDWNRHPLV
jgi:(S)-ureidoglycine aminohydrolase